jgi:hypothetical protein
VSLLAAACSSGGPEPTATNAQAIVHGSPAVNYPEAVYVTSDGYVPCSGVLLTPTVVLSAGHCRGRESTYEVVAPNANGQSAHGSSSWSPYDGNPAKSSDVMLVFLDTPIHIATYPTLGATQVAAGTQVVDIGRTLNGSIGTDDYVSAVVTIQGPGTALGFPYNYEALPDISENGDSGGPIMLAGTHTIVAIVDVDTTEENIAETTPLDLFARIDLVHDAIESAIASHSSSPGSKGGGGCSLARGDVDTLSVLAACLGATTLMLRRRRRPASVTGSTRSSAARATRCPAGPVAQPAERTKPERWT